MSNEPYNTTADSNDKLLRATRRTALRGVSLAGLLAMGGGGVSASQNSPKANTRQNETETSEDDESIPVTWENVVRAQTDSYFESHVENEGLGAFKHYRDFPPIEEQQTQPKAPIADALYSWGIFDLTEPLTITKPDTEGRYQSIVITNQDQYVKGVLYDPGEYTLTQNEVGTRYVSALMRTFVDRNNPDDVNEVHRLQDATTVSQQSSGTFEIPTWEQESLEELHEALVIVGGTMDDLAGVYGDVGEVDPVKHYIGSVAFGPGGLPEPSEALLVMRYPEQNDGETPYTLTIEEPDSVPVDGFWSVTAYDNNWFLVENEYEAYSVSNVTAEQSDDGSVTIHFGGDPDQPNFIYTPEGWQYIVRLYRPREAILDGGYQFPDAQPVE
ncbi:Protein of unknown function [Halogranum amylolyticum]|uniref:DUF1214 domain-containing protein n=1 Tax=Halogranum amylolyticum TaxID=660520 RepID=A0A1H8VBQ0_9EURY|nr:DUF1214 domain-containing protein [Halogranum amylolyticum]SEP12900.1 Protein of unknown function [Halogranum amylolyticum]